MTTESVAPAPDTTKPDIGAIVRRLRDTFATGRTRSIDWRKQQLRALQKLVEDNEPAIAEALASDLGRKPFEAWLADVAPPQARPKTRRRTSASGCAGSIGCWSSRSYPAAAGSSTNRTARCSIIGAWNFPFVLTLGPAVGAIAAGNTVVLKPSEVTPASSALMAELVPRYLDNDAIAVIEGDGAVSQELIEQGFDKLCFTGGTEIGRKVYQSAAPHLTPVTLELGGKSPVIVAADADIDVAAKRIAWVKLINSGQACIAPDYVLADASIRDDLVEKIKEAVTKFESDDAGGKRVVNQRHFDRLTTSLAATKGNVAVGGGSDAASMKIALTVVVDPDMDEPLMTDEIFGPILPVVTVQSLDEAIKFVNSRPKPLAAYLFTKAKDVRERVIKEVSAGGVVVNHLLFQFATNKLPFGGVGPSGMGAYHGKFGFEEFSHRKAVMTKPTRPDVGGFMYPPYTEKAWKLARKLI